MAGYSELKKEQEKNAKRLKEANSKSDKLNDKTDEIMEILDNLKSAPFNKNNSQISNEDVDKIKNYAKDVKDTTKSIKGVNDLNVTIENVEKNYKDLVSERDSLYYSNKEKDEVISDLEMMKKELKDYSIKFVVLLVDEKTLLLRDKERPKDCQMNDRCVILLNSFKNTNYNTDNILDTTNLSIEETLNIIETENRFIL